MRKMEDEIVKKLLEEHPIHEMVKFSDLDLQTKLEENTFKIEKNREIYNKELAILEELEDKNEILVGQRYKFYRFEDDREWTKPEIEKYCLPADKKILQMKRILANQKTRVRFFENCYKGFEKQQWSMKSFIDTIRSGY